jgi:hypothetical protein
MDDVKKCETVLAELELKRDKCAAEHANLESEMKRHSYDAHTGNRKAKDALDKLMERALRIDHELKSVAAAIVEATARLDKARQAEACEQDKVAAEALREVVSKIGERMRKADKCFDVAVQELNAANAELDQVHALGSAFPTQQQLAVNAIMALKTWLRNLPEHWHREFIEALPPNQRRTFSAFWSRMEEPLERSIATRLGEPQKDEVAA